MTETPKNISSAKDVPHVKEKARKPRKLFTFTGLNMNLVPVSEDDMKDPPQIISRAYCPDCGTGYDPNAHDSCPKKPTTTETCPSGGE